MNILSFSASPRLRRTTTLAACQNGPVRVSCDSGTDYLHTFLSSATLSPPSLASTRIVDTEKVKEEMVATVRELTSYVLSGLFEEVSLHFG